MAKRLYEVSAQVRGTLRERDVKFCVLASSKKAALQEFAPAGGKLGPVRGGRRAVYDASGAWMADLLFESIEEGCECVLGSRRPR